MSSSEKDLEQQLLLAVTRLMDPSPSVEELLPLLDQVENCLSKVEQSPSQPMQNALSPSLKALVTEQIFRHPDADVKVAVASCISEITRITAPDAPYDDEQMKEVFQLIVSSFENLFHKSSRSYAKRTSILETVAKVRSCVVMLDLECDALIIEMFRHFFKTVRDYHPENVLASMETIMTLVLEESEDISMELLSPLLACVKRDNEDVMPVARKLAESVIKTCGDKLKPCLTEAVKTSGISLDDYSEVIASICQDASINNSQDDDAIMNQEVHDNKPNIASLDGMVEDHNNDPGEVNPAEDVDIPNEKSGSSISNVSVQENDSLKDTGLFEKQELVAVQSSVDAPTVYQSIVMPDENMVNSERAEKHTRKKVSTSVSLKSVEPSGSPGVNDKEVGSQREKNCEDKHEPDADNEVTDSADDVASPTCSTAVADDNITDKRTEDKQGMIEEAATRRSFKISMLELENRETRDEVLIRHRKEISQLQDKQLALKKAAAKGSKAEQKAKKKQVEVEVSQRMAQLKEKQAEEIAALGYTASNANERNHLDSLVKAVAGFSVTTHPDHSKPSKSAKRREKRAQQEAEREQRIQLEKNNIVSDRMIENEKLERKLEPLGLIVSEIKPDGHCLYRAVEDQLAYLSGGSSPYTYQELREMVAAYMRKHALDFLPFFLSENMIEAESDDSLAEKFENYCKEVESTAAWGGQLELGALTHCLRRHIMIYSGSFPDVEMGKEYASDSSSAAIRLSYHRHAFGLGEHYNSLCSPILLGSSSSGVPIMLSPTSSNHEENCLNSNGLRSPPDKVCRFTRA